MDNELVQVIQQISEELSQTSGWDIAGVIIGGVSTVLTIIVLWFNHRTIKLTQKSIRQTMNLQLYDKRLELYSFLSDEDAFDKPPMELKIVFTEEIYKLYDSICELCAIQKYYMDDFYDCNGLGAFVPSKIESPQITKNVCESAYKEYLMDIDVAIKRFSDQPDKAEFLLRNKEKVAANHQEICSKYSELESSMKEILKGSILP